MCLWYSILTKPQIIHLCLNQRNLTDSLSLVLQIILYRDNENTLSLNASKSKSFSIPQKLVRNSEMCDLCSQNTTYFNLVRLTFKTTSVVIKKLFLASSVVKKVRLAFSNFTSYPLISIPYMYLKWGHPLNIASTYWEKHLPEN